MNRDQVVLDGTMKTTYIVMTAAAKIALCEVEEGKRPTMISERARGMVRILELWDKRNMRRPYQLALAEAQTLADVLNGKTIADATTAAWLDDILLGRSR